MENRIENLKKYGVDIEEVMKRFVDDEEFYLECLDMFFHDDSIENLKISIENNNTKEAFEAAHTLKGIVGNLGLDTLFQKSSLLVEDLRAGNMENADKKYKDIEEEYNIVRKVCE